ncbi:MAG TPA: TIGR01212 family radical SAM protein [Planctomycetota bacterium]|nr:TIGR01212 family radical SAM protein [Planctomycetota bacterium]
MGQSAELRYAGGRRFYPYSQFLKERFGCKVYKLTVDAGFTCPNRDGTKGAGGCIYCENSSFSPAAGSRLSVREQVEKEKRLAEARYGASRFIAYFQPFSNTYAPVGKLRALHDEALSVDGVVGLSLGTRPDCVPPEVLDYLQELAGRTHLWVEYGLQSSHDRTLEVINRGHTFAEFEDAVLRTRGRGIFICVHLILGLPGETREMIQATASRIAKLGIDGVKLHHLHVVRDTALAGMYDRGEIRLLELDEYVRLSADVLERLPPWTVLQRFVGDVQGDSLVAPKWNEGKLRVLEAIQEELERRGVRQGSRYVGPDVPPGWADASRKVLAAARQADRL